ncbi:MAG: tetratricopeptide repeat protein [Crocinitomicaceae bacterium]|nr:tetratricopeptide repeat protein [Crocinitomicaceae bacterium]
MKHLILSLIAMPFCLFAQTDYIDSFKIALEKPVKSDTMRAYQYNEIAWAYLDYSLDSAYKYATKGLNFSKKINYKYGEMDALSTIAIYYRTQAKYEKALSIYTQIEKYRKENNQLERLIGVYSNIGTIYHEMGKYAESIKKHQMAIEIVKNHPNFTQASMVYSNIGAAYKQAGLLDQSIQNYREALKIAQRQQNELQQASIYSNIATIYHERGMYKEALKDGLLAVELLKNHKDIRLLNTIYFNLIIDYKELKDFKNAAKTLEEYRAFAQRLNDNEVYKLYYVANARFLRDINSLNEATKSIDKSLQHIDTTADLISYFDVLNTKADIFILMSRFDDGIKSAQKAYQIAQLINEGTFYIQAAKTLAVAYKAAKQFEKALYYTEEADSLKEKDNIETLNLQIATLNSLNELDKKEQALEITKQKNEKIQAQNNQQQLLIIGLLLIGALVGILLLFTIKSNLERRKANVLLNQKNEEIERQKSLVEVKQTEIIGSIHYAKRIQETLLIQKSILRQYFSTAFIFFQPKDIVSGDFYWATKEGDNYYLAICDSTGHGVPGAFMSALNITFLSEAINQLKLEKPGEVFNHVRERLVNSISHDGARDGMDGILFCFNKSTNQIYYAASQNAPIIVRGEELIKLSCDKMPVGKSDITNSFNTYELPYQKGDVLYAFSDGYADQFGGEQGKKLKLTNFYAYLMEISSSEITAQEQMLQKHFNDWKGENEQLDDVCVLGIKL